MVLHRIRHQHRFVVLAVLLWLSAVPLWAEEILELATPAPAREDQVVGYRLVGVAFTLESDPPALTLRLQRMRSDTECARDTNGICQVQVETYTDTEALAIINGLNIQRTLLDRAKTDGRVEDGQFKGAPGVTPIVPTRPARGEP